MSIDVSPVKYSDSDSGVSVGSEYCQCLEMGCVSRVLMYYYIDTCAQIPRERAYVSAQFPFVAEN